MQPKKHYFAHIPTIAIFIVFAMSAPLGVLLFILKSIDRNAEKEEKAAAQAQADYRSDLGPASAQTAPRQEQDPEAACGTDRPTAEQKSAQNWHKTIAVICTILGAVFLFTGAEELIDCLFDFPDFDDLLPALATTIGGAGALWTGLRMDRTRKLERLLDKIAGDRDNIPLDELFAAAASMPQRGVLQWKAPFPTVTLVPTPTSTTAPLPLWCAVLRPSRPSSRNRSLHRHQRTSTPPFCNSCGRSTMPSRTP